MCFEPGRFMLLSEYLFKLRYSQHSSSQPFIEVYLPNVLMDA